MPNPILVNGAFSSFYVYICTCMFFFSFIIGFWIYFTSINANFSPLLASYESNFIKKLNCSQCSNSTKCQVFLFLFPKLIFKGTSGIFTNEKIVIGVEGEALPDWTQVHSHSSTFILSCWFKKDIAGARCRNEIGVLGHADNPTRPDYCTLKAKTCPWQG